MKEIVLVFKKKTEKKKHFVTFHGNGCKEEKMLHQ